MLFSHVDSVAIVREYFSNLFQAISLF